MIFPFTCVLTRRAGPYPDILKTMLRCTRAPILRPTLRRISIGQRPS